jgi:hypothetical protein
VEGLVEAWWKVHVSTIRLRRFDAGPSLTMEILPLRNSRRIASASILLVALAALAPGSSANYAGA